MKSRYQVFPHGLMLGPTPFKPVMIFKTHDEKEVLPVSIDPVNAGIMMAENESLGRYENAHQPSLQILEKLGVNIVSVYFNEINNTELMCLLVTEQSGKTVQLKFKAREIMSLTVKSGCIFYANEEVVEKSKLLNLEWAMNQSAQFDQGDKTLVRGPGWFH